MKQLREWVISVVVALAMVAIIRPTVASAHVFNVPIGQFQKGDRVLFDKVTMPNDETFFTDFVWTKERGLLGKPVFRFWPINRIGFIKKEK